jgi:transposase InsO family protein
MSDRRLKKLSELLEDTKEPTAKRTIIRLYGDYVRTLRTFDKNSRSLFDTEIIEDYAKVKESYKMTKDDVTLDNNGDLVAQQRQEADESIRRALQPYIMATNRVNLNELVIKPETFNGYKPKPRDWIDAYEEAFIANDWPEATAIKYFPTFLRETALDWYKAMVRPKMTQVTEWQQLRDIFSSHYLGKDELRNRRQEFASLAQGDREPSTNFIPKAYRLLKQIYPRLDEEEATDRIISKLKPDIIKSLPLDGVDSIEDLVSFANRIESRAKQIEQRVKTSTNTRYGNKQYYSDSRKTNDQRKSGQDIEQAKQPEKQEPSSDGNKRSTIQCYRCKDTGHIGRQCTARVAIDGKPLRLPKSEQTKVNNIQEPKLVLNEGIKFHDIVNNVSVGSKVSGSMLFQPLRCNDFDMNGLVDTGSFHTVLDAALVRQNKWKVDLPAPILGAAGNNPLCCIGTCEVTVSVTLNKRTRTATFHFAVVENLGHNMLIGLEFLSIMRIMIDAEHRRLFFKKESLTNRGICSTDNLTIAPRSQSSIEGSVPTKGTILAIPNTLSNGLIIGNSVSRVDKGTVRLIVLNPTTKPVSIPINTQLASYEQIETEDGECNVNRVIEIAGFDESISVGDDLSEDQIRDLCQLLEDNKSAFSHNGRIGELKDERFFHKIELLPGSQPFNDQLRRRPKVHVDETRRQVKALLEAGLIEESESPFASAYLLVRKKSGEYRLCIDFRKLNSISKKFVYPLPNIEECVDTLAGKRYFSLLDFSMGFHQLPMDKDSREYTAFKTEDGLFHYKRMPFGLANAPSSFQKMINATLLGLRGVNLQIFIDDVCVGSDTWAEHITMLDKVLKVISKSNLTLKSSKCVFGAKKVLFLGHIISGDGVRQDPAKTKAILEMPKPKDAAGIQRALGMLGYYRKFIPNFAATSAPLTRLLKKKVAFVWTANEDNALKTLLNDLSKDVLLTQFNHTDPIAVKTDACKSGVAAMLLQLQKGEWRLVTCCSRRLNDHEANYGISELECLAIVYAVEKLRSYLLGKRFQILTDHSALKVLETKNPNSARLRRWALILQEFDFSIVYTKGQLQADVDCLSRAPIDPPDEAVERRIFHIALPVNPVDWTSEYTDDASKRFLELARQNSEEFSLRNNVIYFKNSLYVPPSKVTNIAREAHEGPVACHGGVAVTLAALEPYWWPGKAKAAEELVGACQACQARKIVRTKPAGTMRSFEIFNANELVAIDYLGTLTETIGRNRHIALAIDCFTRFVFARALPDQSADGFAEFLLDYVGTFGIPKRILTDNAMNFKSKRIKEVESTLGITHIFSSPEHSQGNALAERAIQSLQEKINLVCKQHNLEESDWDKILPLAVLALNTSQHKSIGYSPFELRFGEKHRLFSASLETKSRTALDTHVSHLIQKLDNVRAIAGTRQRSAQAAAKERYDREHRPITFEPDTLVQVRAKARRSKLADKYERICKVVSHSNDIYTLVDTHTNQILIRHINKLKKYTAPQHSINCIQHDTMNLRTCQQVAVILSLVAVQALGDSAFRTPRESFVLWKEEQQHVIKIKQEYEIKIAFIDPCIIIGKDFPSFWSSSTEEYNTVYNAYWSCSENYRRNILTPLDEMVERHNVRVREPRHIALLGLFGGLWLSNVLDSYFNDNSAIILHEQQQDEALQALNRRQNYSTQAVVELAKVQGLMLNKINELYDEMEAWKREIIKLQFALNYINLHLGLKRAAIDQLRFDLINGKRLNLHALNNLLDTKIFENIDSNTLEFISVKKLKDERYVFRFYGHEIDEDMRIYKVKAVKHWINVTESPATLVSYDGPPMTLVNTTNGCIVGIYDIKTDSISQGCKKQNGRSLELDSWRVERTGNPFVKPAPTIFIEKLPNMVVYCLGRSISIADEVAIDCPPYPISIPATVSWKTDDKSFDGYNQISHNVTIFDSIPAGIIPELVSDPKAKKFVETDALKKIYNLTAELEKVQQEALILNTPVGGMSHSLLNKIILSSVGSLLCIVVWMWRHQHQMLNAHHDKLARIIGQAPIPLSYPDLKNTDDGLAKKENLIIDFIKSCKKTTPATSSDSPV